MAEVENEAGAEQEEAEKTTETQAEKTTETQAEKGKEEEKEIGEEKTVKEMIQGMHIFLYACIFPANPSLSLPRVFCC